MIDRLSDGLASAHSKFTALLAPWTQSQRLYNVSGEGPVNELLVEQFTRIDRISEPFVVQLTALTLNAGMAISDLLGKRITLVAALSDGSTHQHSGVIFHASQLDADGGFQRLQVNFRPWVQMLANSGQSRAWQGKSVVDIIDTVLGDPAYSGYAAWRWGESSDDGAAEDIHTFLAQGPNAGIRDFCCQYRETDLAFLQRLLASEGLGWRVEEAADAPSGHRMVLFASSSQWPHNPTSATTVGGVGIKFQRSAAVEEQDAIQAFGGQRQLNPAASALLQWNYLSKSALAADAPTNHAFGSPSVQDMSPWLETYQPLGAAADTGPCSSAQLQHLATLRQQAHEFHNKTWLGRSSVRSLRAGEWFQLKHSPLDALSQLAPNGAGESGNEFTVHSVQALGINNLPKELSQALAARAQAQAQTRHPFDDWDPWRAPATPNPTADLLAALADDPELSAQAAETGYANRFEAVRRAIPWRPLHAPKPTAMGVQTALVTGPDGSTTASGADELYTDALGRIKVQFHWQSSPHADPRPDNRNTCWVRVAQRWAGAGMGHQFIPRIGQEVIVNFIEGDIDRPVVTGAVYNGRGEAGMAPTPGGSAGTSDLSPYAQSSDHRPSAQGNLMGSGAGGHSPAWHGGAPGTAAPGANAQNNAAALSGVKSKEFGGEGFNQLVFDDTPGQLRVQLASTQHASQLNLGYLVHQADNHRGGFRGEGFELRTDAYGAVRAAQGLLLTSYGTQEADPAGDNAPGMALLKHAELLTETFSNAAKTHQTTALATAIGSTKAGQSPLSDKAAPVKALHTAASGMVSAHGLDAALADAGQTATAATQGKLPHTTDPIVAISAKAGLATVAGQDVQWASGDTISLQAGQDVQVASGGQMRVHTGQSLGMLAGAVQAGEGAKGTGLTMIAGQGPVQMQAQAGQAQIAAKNLINIQTASAHIDWAAAKKITLVTSGGASIEISADGITTQCPGKITVKAAKKSFVGPGAENYTLPRLPQSATKPTKLSFDLMLTTTPGPDATPMANYDWQIVRTGASARDRVIVGGQTDDKGKLVLTPMQELRLSVAAAKWPDDLELWAPGVQRPLMLFNERPDWTADQKNLHALAALDYSDMPGFSPMTDEGKRERTRAGESAGVTPSYNFFEKIQ